MRFTSLASMQLAVTLLGIFARADEGANSVMSLDSKEASLIQLDQEVKGYRYPLGKSFLVSKKGKHDVAFLCNPKEFNKESKLQFKSGWLYEKRYKNTDKCKFFFDDESETLVNLEENDKSVIIQKRQAQPQKDLLELVLKDTNTYAPGSYPFQYGGKNGGALGYQWLATNQGKTNVLCYKWLNLYQFKTQAWIDLENSTRKKWELRHHEGCYLQFKIVSSKKRPRPAKPSKASINALKHYGLISMTPFYVVSKSGSGRFLDIINSTNMVTKTRNGFKTQQWIFNHRTSTIESVAKPNFSWDIQGAGTTTNMQVWKTNKGWFQIFKFKDGHFINEKGKYLDAGNAKTEGANTFVAAANGQKSQLWEVIYLSKMKDEVMSGFNSNYGFYKGRAFYLVSKLPMNRVLEVQGGRNLFIRLRAGRATQQFYFDQVTKTIKSKAYPKLSIDIQNSGKSNNLQILTTNARWFQYFHLEGEFLINEKGKAVQVEGNTDVENQNVNVNVRNGQIGQKWSIMYVDQVPKEPVAGEFIPEFGLKMNEDFNIVSAMSSGRYLERIDSTYIRIKTRNANSVASTAGSEQVFFFNYKTRTIVCKGTSYNIQIESNGKGQLIRATNANSRWWSIFRYEGQHIVNTQGKVLDVYAGKDEENQKVIAYNKHNGVNQKWKIVYLKDAKAMSTKGISKYSNFYINRPFLLRSTFQPWLYMRASGGSINIDTLMKQADKRQMTFTYYEDKKMIFNNYWKTYHLDIQSNGAGTVAQLSASKNMRWWSMHKLIGEYLTNEKGKVLEAMENRKLRWATLNKQVQQKWQVVYEDELPKDFKTGEINTDYGFLVNKDFYLVSALPSKRHLQRIPEGNNLVIKLRNDRSEQKFFFDQSTETVRSRAVPGYSWNANGSGKQQSLSIAGTSQYHWWQKWAYKNGKIVNLFNNKCFDVHSGNDSEGIHVIQYAQHKGLNQKWTVVYVEDAVKEKTTGFNKDFGMKVGKPFFLISQMPFGRALTMVGGRNLVIQTKVNSNKAQQFYFDIKTKTVKSELYKDRSIDIQGSGTSSNVWMYTTNSRWWQMFKLKGAHLENIQGKVLNVSTLNDAQNSNVNVNKKGNIVNQKWNIIYVDEVKPDPKKGEFVTEYGLYNLRDFYIISAMPSRRYLDRIGSNVVTKVPNGRSSQKWFFDYKNKGINSRQNPGYVVHMQANGKGKNIEIAVANQQWWQLFKYQGEHIVNHYGKVLDVYQGLDIEGQTVINWNKHNGLNQKWKIVYVDQAPKVSTKGMNKYFGFYINRPFIMISQLPNKKYLEMHGNTYVYITDPVNPPKPAQQFVFDQKSKTIRNNNWKNYIINIQSNGNSNVAIMTTTINSRWWQLHKYNRPYLTNENGKVLDVTGGRDVNMNRVQWWKLNKTKSQHWDVVYVDELPRDPIKGEMNSEFGFIVERDFYLVSQLPSRRLLTRIEDANKVVIKVQNGLTNQKWFFNQKTLSLHNREIPSYGLNVISNGASQKMNIVSIGAGKKWWQMFKIEGAHIINVKSNLALDVFGGKDAEMQEVIQWKKHNGNNQKWSIVYCDTFKSTNKGFNKEFGFYINREFVIMSKFLDDTYVEIDGNANYYMRKLVYKPKVTQTFFFDDKSKMIKSKQYKQFNLAILSKGTSQYANGNQGGRSRWWELQKLRGDFIQNEKGKVLDMDFGSKRLIWTANTNKLTQKWRVIYIDTIKPDTLKGELNKKYGLKVNTDFYLQTALSSGRFMTYMDKNNELLLKVRNGSNRQIYFFDQKSKTIRLRKQPNYQLSMGGNGTKKSVLTIVKGAGDWFTHFKYDKSSKQIIFIHEDKVIDVSGGKDEEGNLLILHKKHNGKNQKWNVIYASELKREDNKTFNKEYGFYPGRDFILISAMPNHRKLISHTNNQLVIKNTVAGAPGKEMIFHFDMKSKLIISRYRNYAMALNSANSQGRFVSNAQSFWYELFKFDGQYLTNEKGLTLDAEVDADLRQCYFRAKNTKKISQKWSLIYKDEYKPIKKGDFVSEYGLFHERPFYIQSTLPTGRYLENVAGYAIIKTFNNQNGLKWKFDFFSKSIVSISNNQVLGVQGNGAGHAKVNLQGKAMQPYQMFRFSNGQLKNILGGKVISVEGGQDTEGQKTWVWTANNGANQKWNIIYVDQKKPEQSKGLNKQFGLYVNRPFVIQTQMPSGNHLHGHGNRYTYTHLKFNPPRATEQFIFDGKTKVIQRINSNFYLEIQSNGAGQYAYLGGAVNSRWWQIHAFDGQYLRNLQSNKVLDTAGQRDTHMNHAIWATKTSSKSQKWNILYVDQIPRDPIKNEMNTEYGFIVERDFYIISALPSRRLITKVQGSNTIFIKTQVNLPNQKWFFDGKQKIIINRETTTHALQCDANKVVRVGGKTSNAGLFWKYDGTYMQSNAFQTVLEVPNADDNELVQVKMATRNGQAKQQWSILYADTVKSEATKGLSTEYGMYINRPFVLISQLPMNRYAYFHPNSNLYAHNTVATPNTRFQFYFDIKQKVVRSKAASTFAINIQSNGGGNVGQVLGKVRGRWWQMFKFTGNYFVNIKGKTLSINKDTHMDILQFIPKNKSKFNGLNQKWSLKYMDELPKPPKKGDWCSEYGFHHMRDFHLVSALPAGRYLDQIGFQTVIKVPNGRSTQTWYFDWVTRSVRSRATTANGLHLQSNGNANQVIIRGVTSQWWQIFKFANGRVQNVLNKKVLSVKDGKDEEANQVWQWIDQNGLNQKWKVIYVDEVKAAPTKGLNKQFNLYINRNFLLVSQLYQQRWMGNLGNKIYLTNRQISPSNHQIWYFNEKTKTIMDRTRNTHSLSIVSNGAGSTLISEVTNSRWWQLFKWTGINLVNEKGKVLEGGPTVETDTTNRPINAKTTNKKLLTQRWDLIYVDQFIKDPKKGQLNRDFGLRVDTDFHIISELPSRRYLNNLSNNLVIKTQNGRKDQIFYFDQNSRVIRSRTNNQCIHQKNNGKAENMEFSGVSGLWWQLWKYEGTNFVNVHTKKVFDVSGGQDTEAQNVQAYKKHNGANQRWTVVYLENVKKAQKSGLNKSFGFFINRPFFIVSSMPMGRVVQDNGWFKTAEKSTATTQLFQFDQNSKTITTVNNKANCISIYSNGNHPYVYRQPVISRWWQLHYLRGNYIVNMKGKVLDVNTKVDGVNQHVGFTAKIAGSQNYHQMWKIVYKDEDESVDYKKGDFVKEYGFNNLDTFHIVTALPSRRYLETTGDKSRLKVSNGRNQQIWYFDWKTRTIKNKSNNQALTIQAKGTQNGLQIAAIVSQWWQIFKYQGENIVNWKGKAIDVYEGKDIEGQEIIMWEKHKGLNQKWKIVYTKTLKAQKSSGYSDQWGFHINRPFIMISQLPNNKYLEMHGNTYVYITDPVNPPKPAQQFVFDLKSKTIRNNNWKNYIINIQSNGNSNVAIMTTTINSRWWQLHKYKQQYLTNENGKVLDVTGGRDVNMNRVQWWKLNKTKSQLWDVVYVDEIPRDPIKGEMNSKFGFIVERDFYFVTALPSRRIISIDSRNKLMIKVKNNYSHQKWFFDQASKTIKSRHTTSKSLEIKGSGSQMWLGYITTSASHWWQKFKYEDGYIVNMQNQKVFDVYNGKDQESQNVIIHKKHTGKNQQWNIVYCDSVKADRTHGLNKVYNFYINKPFYLISQMPWNRALHMDGGSNLVVRSYVKNKKEQLFYFCEVNKTIKSTLYKNRSITIAGSGQSANAYMEAGYARWWQQFKLQGEHLLNINNNKALEVYKGLEFEGQNVVFINKHNGINQKWRVVYADKAPNIPVTGDFVADWGFKHNQEFHIISALPSRRYLTILDNLVIKTSNGSKSQRWYFNYAFRAIISTQNQHCIAQVNKKFITKPFSSLGQNQWQGNFKYVGAHIENIKGLVLDVEGASDKEGQNVFPYKKHNGINQKWQILYVNTMKKPKGKGLNENFGLFINRPFVLMPQANDLQYATYNGGYIRTMRFVNPPNTHQQFVFDQVTKTIRTKAIHNSAFEVQSNGAGRWAVYNTNIKSRWWQLHRWRGDQLVNDKGKVLEYQTSNNYITQWSAAGKQISKKWNLTYVDELPRDPIKGEFATDWGWIVETDFFIVSQMPSGRYLELLDKGPNNTQYVIKVSNGRKGQRFYFDYKTKTIKTRSQNHSIQRAKNGASNEITGVNVGVNSEWWHHYKRDGDYIFNTKDKKVLSVSGADKEMTVCNFNTKKNKSAHQKWRIIYADKIKTKTKGFNKVFGFFINRPFVIISKLPMNRVITAHGSHLRISTLGKSDTRQEWYFDEVSKQIRNKKANTVISIQSNGAGKYIMSETGYSRWWNLWYLEGEYLRNERGKVIDINSSADTENQVVVSSDRHSHGNPIGQGPSQQWIVKYTDELDTPLKKGDFNKNYGFYIERDFYIVSAMTGRRYLDNMSNIPSIKTRITTRKQQVWYFDQKVRAIKSRSNNYGMQISSNGKGAVLSLISNVSGRWWQMFKFDGAFIQNIYNKQCLDVYGGQDKEGQKVIAHPRHNGINQKWSIIYVDEAKPESGKGLNKKFGFHINREFILINQQPNKLWLSQNGANLIASLPKYPPTVGHRFYFDQVSKTIKSVQYKNYSLDISSNGGGNNAATTTTNSRWWQMFTYTGTHIKNIQNGKSLDLNNIDTKNTNVLMYDFNQKKQSQHWSLVYIDEMTKETKTGELNKEYGLIVNKDFFIISQLPTRRFLSALSTTDISIKTRFEQGANSQKWYFEQATRTIKSRRFNQALTFEKEGKGNKLQLSKAEGFWYQLHKIQGENIVNAQSKKVIDVAGGSDVEGQGTIWWPRHNGANQRWSIILCDKLPEPVSGLNTQFGFYLQRPFYLFSSLPMKRALYTQGGHLSLDQWKQGNKLQQFYFDQKTKTIRSWNKRTVAMSIQSSGTGRYILMETSNSRWWQMFYRKGEYIVNTKGLVLQSRDNHDRINFQSVAAEKKTSILGQKWTLVYADEAKPECKKGKFCADYGLFRERNFYIISALPTRRYLDLIGNNIVIKTQNNFPSQMWYFDYNSRTIKSRRDNRSIAIQNKGSGKNLESQGTETTNNWYQIWKFMGGQILNAFNNKAIDVFAGKDDEGQNVIAWQKHKGINQKWDIVYVDAAPKIKGKGLNTQFGFFINRPFVLIPESAPTEFMEMSGNTYVITKLRKNPPLKQQQFQFDEKSKVIFNMNWKNYLLEIMNQGTTDSAVMNRFNVARWWQLHYLRGPHLINTKGKHLNRQSNGKVTWMGANKKIDQKWTIKYVDEIPRDPIKGELNTEYGFIVEEPFYLVSQLPSRRHLQYVDDLTSLRIKIPNGQIRQEFIFHGVSKTLQPYKMNKALSIKTNGASQNVGVQAVNSNSYQLWKLEGEHVVSTHNGKALDVYQGKDLETQEVIVGGKTAGLNQKWRVVYVKDFKEQTKGFNKEFGLFINRPFFFVNMLPMERVLAAHGTNLVIKGYNRDDKSQQFTFNYRKKAIMSLHPSYKAMSLTIQSKGTAKSMILEAANSRWYQIFRVKGDMIQNSRGLVVDVQGGNDSENSNVWSFKVNRTPAQRWSIRYLDEYRDPVKTEVGPGWGFKIDTDFYIVSALPSRRYLDLVSNRAVIKTPNARSSQIWYFDWKTKTIRTRQDARYSLHIQSNGGGQNLEVSGTNSNWWQLFKLVGENIINVKGKAIDVYQGKDQEGQNVIMWVKTNGLNQRWKIVYVKDAPKAPTQGFNKEYGFFINRPFVFQSQCPMNYVLGYRGGSGLGLRYLNKSEKQQQWYWDQASKTIMSVYKKNFSLTIASNNEAQYLATNSRWMQMHKMKGELLINLHGKALNFDQAKENVNQLINFSTEKGNTSQRWRVLYIDDLPKSLKTGDLNTEWGFRVNTDFLIQTALASRRVADNIGNSIILKTRNSFKTQVWYFDNQYKMIRSRAKTSFVLSISSNGNGENLDATSQNRLWYQKFKYVGEHIVSPYNHKAVDVYKKIDAEAQNIIIWKKHQGLNQKWKIVYLDDTDKEPVKGLNKQFGFFINRPFYLISAMPMGRCLTTNSQNLIITQKRAGTTTQASKQQQFFFNGPTKTIISNVWKDRSIDITSSGKGVNTYMSATNARWWQLWKVEGAHIVNIHGKVLRAEKDLENFASTVWKKSGELNQKWKVVYVDEMETDPKDGDLAKEWGFKINRDFFLISALPARRHLDFIPGNKLVIKTRNGRISQKYYFHWQSRTIRARANNQSLDLEGNGKGRYYKLAGTNSNWWQLHRFDSGYIRNVQNSKVLSIWSGQDLEGQQVASWAAHNGQNQIWSIMYVDQAPKTPSQGLNKKFGFFINRPFVLQSRLPQHRVLKANGANAIQQDHLRTDKTQVFFFDQISKTIKSQNNKSQSLHIQSEGKGNNCEIRATTSRWWQMHYMKGNFLTNEKGKVLDVSGGADNNNQQLYWWKKHSGINQQWTILYLDEMAPEPKIGDFVPEYGMKYKVDFYLVSQLPSRRYIDLIGKDMKIKTPNGRLTQKFYFDYLTKTIVSKQFTNMSFDIKNSGASTNMQVYNTNRKWNQVFKIDGEHVVNVRGAVLSVLGKDSEAANIGVAKKNGSTAQHWKIVYCNSVKDNTTGFNEQFGFQINKPFFFISELYMGYALRNNGHTYTWNYKDTNQQWKFDQVSKTIRSVASPSNALGVNPSNNQSWYYSTANSRWNQLMKFQDGYLQSNKGNVLTIPDGKFKSSHQYADKMTIPTFFIAKKTSSSCKAESSCCHGENQRWKIVYLEDYEKEWLNKGDYAKDNGFFIERPFYLMSRVPSRRYLEVYPNKQATIRTPTRSLPQTFYYSWTQRTIMSKQWTNYQLAIEQSGAKDQVFLRANIFTPYGKFVYNGEHIISPRSGLALETMRSDDIEYYETYAKKKSSRQVAQRWEVIYVDEAPKLSTEFLNKEYGFYINRPFIFVSWMHNRKALEMHKAKSLLINSKDFTNIAQQFYFDQTTKTVKSILYRDHSISLNTGNNNAELMSTNAQWNQRIRINGEYITNEKGMNLNVEDGKDIDQNSVDFKEGDSSLGQRWEVLYLDEEKVKITEAKVETFKNQFEKEASLKFTKQNTEEEVTKTVQVNKPKSKLFF